MLLARQTDARATFVTAANLTLGDTRHKVNEGSYPLACRQRRHRTTKSRDLKLFVAVAHLNGPAVGLVVLLAYCAMVLSPTEATHARYLVVHFALYARLAFVDFLQ
jgi:hypothetical protein